MANKLQKDGVPVAHRNFEGVTHEFFGMGAVVDKAREAVDFATENLKEAFGGKKQQQPEPSASDTLPEPPARR